MADAVHGDLPFLHGLQQRRLGAGGGPVQLVRQKQIGQHPAGLVAHLPGLGIGQTVARHIRGQHIRGELNPAVAQIQYLGKCQRHGGLAHAGHIFQKNVSLGKNGRQHPQQGGVLSHHSPAYLVQDLLGCSCYGVLLCLHRTAPFLGA